jgi:hypothetical protein
MGVDRSGPDKLLRELRPLAHRSYCVGGGATRDREQLDRLDQQVVGKRRLLPHARQHDPPAAGRLQVEIESTERQMRRLSERVQGANGTGPDQVTLARVLKAAEMKLPEVDDKYRRLANQPYIPAEVRDAAQRELMQAQRAEVSARVAFEAGREKLQRLNDQLQAGKARYFRALLASASTACEVIGAKCLEIVLEDAELYAHFPDNIPKQVEVLHRKAREISGHMDKIEIPVPGSPMREGRGMMAFWRGCGDGAVIVAERVNDVVVMERKSDRASLGAQGAKDGLGVL